MYGWAAVAAKYALPEGQCHCLCRCDKKSEVTVAGEEFCQPCANEREEILPPWG